MIMRLWPFESIRFSIISMYIVRGGECYLTRLRIIRHHYPSLENRTGQKFFLFPKVVKNKNGFIKREEAFYQQRTSGPHERSLRTLGISNITWILKKEQEATGATTLS